MGTERSWNSKRLAVAMLAWLAAGAVWAEARYAVRIDRETPRSISVEATLVPDGGELWMNDSGDQGLADGWGGFVRDLEARDTAGEPIGVEPAGLSRWRLARGSDERVTVSYRVRLEHDRADLNFGDNGAAYARGGAVMWAGRALFIVGSETDDVEVAFSLPADWRVTTAWNRAPDTTFRPADTDDLVNSAFMAGEHVEEIVSEGGLELRLALAGAGVISKRAQLVGELREYLDHFQLTLGPAPSRTMVVIAADSPYWGGEVMGRAISLSVGGEIADPDPMLSHLFAHEIVHLWGLDMSFDPELETELYWLYEGMLAEYLSYLANVRAGDLSEEAWRDALADHYGKYLAARRDDLSLAAAGASKAENYDLVYSGGLVVGAALDLMARRETGNRLGVEDLFRMLYRDFPSGDGSRARAEVPLLDGTDVVEMVGRLFGRPVADALATWLTGKEVVPLDDLLEVAGLALAEDGEGVPRFVPVESPSELQRSVYRSLVGP